MINDTLAADPCRPLAEASARIGADPALIQAAGGNTSLKEGGTLWVKASGLWLRDALERPMFVAVDLAVVRERVRAGEPDPVGPAWRREVSPEALRPSIETPLHALMPHAVVLHAHSVDALAWAVQPDGREALAEPLVGLRWAWVPYARPGLALTRAVAEGMRSAPQADVLVLQNHGVLVGAESVAEAEALLADVVGRLRRPLRTPPPADREALRQEAAGTGWRLPADARVHAIATDRLNLARASRGVLYPDHVVFLGHRLTTVPAGLRGAALTRWLTGRRAFEAPPPFVAVAGRGLLVRDDLGEAALEMLACLADVLVRLPEAPEPLFLSPEEAEGLADWEAERYRKQLVR